MTDQLSNIAVQQQQLRERVLSFVGELGPFLHGKDSELLMNSLTLILSEVIRQITNNKDLATSMDFIQGMLVKAAFDANQRITAGGASGAVH